MQKNTASQYFNCIAFNGSGAVTGDAANIDCSLSIDDATEVSLDASSPVEIGTGMYRFALTQAETNGDKLAFRPYSATTGVSVLGSPSNVIYTETAVSLSITNEIIETLLANQDAGETPLITVGTRWSSSITTDDITDATAVYYTVKRADEVDTAAILLVRLPINGGGGDTGITAVNGQTAVAAGISATDAAITTTTDGDDVTYTMTCEGEASALFPTTTTIERTSRAGYPRVTETSGYYTEWKLTGDHDRVIAQGRLKIKPGFVRATS